MSEAFMAEVRIMAFNWAPRGWALCDGQTLPIEQNTKLYSLLGNRYGGDNETTFGLPDLRSRTPIGQGEDYYEGERGGEETHTLSVGEIPSHTHLLNGTDFEADDTSPQFNLLAKTSARPNYVALANPVPMSIGTIGGTGGGKNHQNMQPFLALSYCIALYGAVPIKP